MPRTEETTLFLHDGQWISLFASKTGTLSNLRKNCQRNKQEGNKIDIVVFAIPTTPREPTAKAWRKAIREEFGWKLEVRSATFLSETAAEPKYDFLVEDYLHIPPPGGDFIQQIEDSFKKHAAKALQNISTTIPGLPSSIQRDETSSVEDQLMLGNSVLLTGEAGSGKSGIALELARSAREQMNKEVLFIDARQLGYVQNDGQLRQHFSLNGSLDDAVKRLARHDPNGLRIVIDQLDNTVGSPAAELLIDFAISLNKTPRVDVIVVSRDREAHEAELLRKLQFARFVELTSHPLGEQTVIKVLERAEQMIAEAARLAKLGLNDSKRTFPLPHARTPSQRRLESCGLIRREAGDIFRFRHEKLQDFMFAWDAVRLEMMPQQVTDEISDVFRTRNVMRWMQKLYTKRAPSTAARFARELAESSRFPFYTRASVLDDYIQSPQTIRDADLLVMILQIIQGQQELRAYFFRSRPHPLWAQHLWAAGFFETPPHPEPVDEDHIVIPRWDVQEFLLWVAPSVPDVVLKHVEHISAHKNYWPGAIRALCLIPGYLAETRLDIVAGWLDQDDLWSIADQTIELIKKLTSEQRYESALRLFRALTVPVPSKNVHRVEIESLVVPGKSYSPTLCDEGAALVGPLEWLGHRRVEVCNESQDSLPQFLDRLEARSFQ